MLVRYRCEFKFSSRGILLGTPILRIEALMFVQGSLGYGYGTSTPRRYGYPSYSARRCRRKITSSFTSSSFDVGLTGPRLWSILIIKLSKKYYLTQETWLTRSANYPLSVCLNDSYGGYVPLDAS
ncbi:unnamed protein product [Cyclocybe aegerita]|uniref:Uncharacterized protein n=1 Tax=Cyclocybe aegerita TaxID=1973307 RepID=A0A8S0VZN5_CYCAE|nr:unnamed protein product [Cyclocybe aegerita]